MSLLRRRIMMRIEEEPVKEWKLLCEKTLEEDIASFSVAKDANGDDFAVKELIVIVMANAASKSQYLRIAANNKTGSIAYGKIVETSKKAAKLHAMIVAGKFMDVGSLFGNNEYSLSGMSSYGSIEGSNVGDEIREITFTTNTGEPLLTSGSKYIVYGR